jgi:hypothetical protein
LILITGLTGAQPAKPVLKPVGLSGLSDKIPDQNGHSATTTTTSTATAPVKKVTFLERGLFSGKPKVSSVFTPKFEHVKLALLDKLFPFSENLVSDFYLRRIHFLGKQWCRLIFFNRKI